MKPWQFAVVGLVLPAVVGCRSNPAIPILERQLRLQEDEIFRLRGTIEDLQDAPDSCRGWSSRASRTTTEPEIAPRRKFGGAAPNGVRPPVIELPSRPAGKVPESLQTPAESLPFDVPDVPEELQNPSKAPGSGANGPALDNGIMAKTTSRPSIPFAPSGDSRQAASIVLDRMLTGGISSDDRSGDQGLLVVVEPRDAAGRTVDAPADVSVVVIDPALKGDAARVARWEFTAAETAALFRRVGSSRAIHLAIAWPDAPPQHNKLRLFVRYVTADGRKLHADGPLEVSLAGEKTARWTLAESGVRTSSSAPPRAPASKAWRSSETPTAQIPDPSPHAAQRRDESKPQRPVWSPERR